MKQNRITKKDKGAAMILAVMFVMLLTMLVGSYLDVVSSGSMGTAFMDRASQSFYAAEAGVHGLIGQINSGGASSIAGSLTTSTYTASYAASYDASTSLITSTGSVASGSEVTGTRTVVVRTKVIPPGVLGAATTNCSVTTSGNITIDGRDHDTSGNATGAAGVYGITAAGTITQSGSSQIGGNGYAPASPVASSAIKQNVGALSRTQPWDILGVSQTWFDTNIFPTTTEPSGNFSGIVYYQPPGGTWNSADLGDSSGILIVHNDTNTAKMKNVHGTYRGLIIADRIQNINGNANIYGALIVTDSQSTTLGNGNAFVEYSSKILQDLRVLVASQTSSWKRVINAGSWQEQ